MSINKAYRSPNELPTVIPVLPLEGALLLPRGELPLNIFEERYLALVDDVMKSHRIIGMVQPASADDTAAKPALLDVGCAGRITEIAETGDGRYLVTLTGIARFRIASELDVTTAYRQCAVGFDEFVGDFSAGQGEQDVDRDAILRTLRDFADNSQLSIDWDGIRRAPNEWLVNALSMMSPCGPREKQALLEAPDLKARAEMLVAITEGALARDARRQPLH
jgi:Lon protease-like protein